MKSPVLPACSLLLALFVVLSCGTRDSDPKSETPSKTSRRPDPVWLGSKDHVQQPEFAVGDGIEGDLKPNTYARTYTSGETVLRRFNGNLESAHFIGNGITAVDGFAWFTNEAGDTMASGQLQVVGGWIALPAASGTRFRHIPQLDTQPEFNLRRPLDDQAIPPTVVLTSDGSWVLKDDRFMLLIDHAWGLEPDFSSSFARHVRILLEPKQSLELWGASLLAGSNGGEVVIASGYAITSSGIEIRRR